MKFDRRDLESLLVPRDGSQVSLLMPTHGPSLEAGQDPIRYERLIRSAMEDMTQAGVGRSTRESVGGQCRQLASSAAFWRDRSQGLAVYATGDELWHFRVPLPLDELAVVGPEFEIAPLAPLMDPQHFWMVAVSRSGVRLYDGTAYGIAEVTVKDAPSGLEEVTQYYQFEKQLQFRQVATVGRGTQVAMFHGHGIGEIRDRELVLQYLRAVDRSVRRALPSPEAPLIVCGPGEVPGLYRQVSHHGGLIDRQLEIHPDGAAPAELHERSLELVREILERPVLEATRRLDALAGTGKTSDSIEEMLPAASQGRVDTLLVPPSDRKWGRFEDGAAVVHAERRPGDVELVNLIVVLTLRHGGQVVSVGDRPLTAVYRY